VGFFFFFWRSCSFLGKKKKEKKRKGEEWFWRGWVSKEKRLAFATKVSLPSMGVQVLLQVAQVWAQTKMTSYLHHPPESNPM
jgi:hypothetical protein